MRAATLTWLLLALALPGCVLQGEESADGPMDGDVVGRGPDTLPDEGEGSGDVDPGSTSTTEQPNGTLPGVPANDALGEEVAAFPRMRLEAGTPHQEGFSLDAASRVTLVLAAVNRGTEDALLVVRMTGPSGTTAEESVRVPADRDALVQLTLEGETLEGQDTEAEVVVDLESDQPLDVSGGFHLDAPANGDATG